MTRFSHDLPREEEDRGEDEGPPPTEVRQGDGRHEAAEDGAEGSEARCNRGMIRSGYLHTMHASSFPREKRLLEQVSRVFLSLSYP